jgi:FixJ family two-component response regulator
MRNSSTKDTKALTQRQRQVVQLLAQGLSMKEAADTLKVQTRTVAFHKYKIMGTSVCRTIPNYSDWQSSSTWITPQKTQRRLRSGSAKSFSSWPRD